MGLRPGSRLAWFAFWVDDWVGGTMCLSVSERGAYMTLLCLQWSSKDAQAIPDDPQRLDRLTEGNFTPQVRAKFADLEIEGRKYLQNERLAAEWRVAKAQHEHALKGNKARWGDAQPPSEDIPKRALGTSEPEPDPQSDSESESQPEPRRKKTTRGKANGALRLPSLASRAREVFAYWQTAMGHQDAIFGPERERAVIGRLKQGFTVDRLKAAIDGCKRSAYHQGDNDKKAVYDDLELIARDTKHVEQFIRIGANGHDREANRLLVEHDEFIRRNKREEAN